MALAPTVSGPPWGGDRLPPLAGRRTTVEQVETVPLAAATVVAFLADVPGWPQWEPLAAEVSHLSGPQEGRGMVNRLVLGHPAGRIELIHRLTDASPEALRFTGEMGRALRFVEIVNVRADGEASVVRRRLDLRVGSTFDGVLAPVIAFVGRSLRRSLVP